MIDFLFFMVFVFIPTDAVCLDGISWKKFSPMPRTTSFIGRDELLHTSLSVPFIQIHTPQQENKLTITQNNNKIKTERLPIMCLLPDFTGTYLCRMEDF